MNARRSWVLVAAALLIAGGVLAYVSYGRMGDNLVYYLTPSELLAKGEKAYHNTVRLGGVVASGSVNKNAPQTLLQFRVADSDDPAATTVVVESNNHPPEMFREKIGVVVEGQLDNQRVFHADRVLVNHSNEYRAPAASEKTARSYGSETLKMPAP